MMKLNSKNNLLLQIEKIKRRNKKNIDNNLQIDSKNLYVYYDIFYQNKIDIISYYTKIMEYNTQTNILYITKNKYSRTTTIQQNKIIDNFIKYNNSKIIYTNQF